jgi:hypothetical protein
MDKSKEVKKIKVFQNIFVVRLLHTHDKDISLQCVPIFPMGRTAKAALKLHEGPSLPCVLYRAHDKG